MMDEGEVITVTNATEQNEEQPKTLRYISDLKSLMKYNVSKLLASGSQKPPHLLRRVE